MSDLKDYLPGNGRTLAVLRAVWRLCAAVVCAAVVAAFVVGQNYERVTQLEIEVGHLKARLDAMTYPTFQQQQLRSH